MSKEKDLYNIAQQEANIQEGSSGATEITTPKSIIAWLDRLYPLEENQLSEGCSQYYIKR
jgi:hypothetical protein